MGARTERAEAQRGRENEVDLKRRRRRKKKNREGTLCFGGVNILELLPTVQKVTANINVCIWIFLNLFGPSYVCMHMHVYTILCVIVCYFLLGIFTTLAVSDRVFICGSCRVQSSFCIVLL